MQSSHDPPPAGSPPSDGLAPPGSAPTGSARRVPGTSLPAGRGGPLAAVGTGLRAVVRWLVRGRTIRYAPDGPDEVAARIADGSAVLVDTREPFERRRRRIAGSVGLPLSRLDQMSDAELAAAVPPGTVAYLHCEQGTRGLIVGERLAALGVDARPVRLGPGGLAACGAGSLVSGEDAPGDAGRPVSGPASGGSPRA